MKERRHISPKEKLIILRELFEGNSTVSQLAEKYQIHPNVIFNWKKKLFESAPEIFLRKPRSKSDTAAEAKIKTLRKNSRKGMKLSLFLFRKPLH